MPSTLPLCPTTWPRPTPPRVGCPLARAHAPSGLIVAGLGIRRRPHCRQASAALRRLGHGRRRGCETQLAAHRRTDLRAAEKIWFALRHREQPIDARCVVGLARITLGPAPSTYTRERTWQGLDARRRAPRLDGMSSLPEPVVRQLEIWIATRRSVKVAQNLSSDDPDNPLLQERLRQAILFEQEAGLMLRTSLRSHGCSPQALQQELRRTA